MFTIFPEAKEAEKILDSFGPGLDEDEIDLHEEFIMTIDLYTSNSKCSVSFRLPESSQVGLYSCGTLHSAASGVLHRLNLPSRPEPTTELTVCSVQESMARLRSRTRWSSTLARLLENSVRRGRHHYDCSEFIAPLRASSRAPGLPPQNPS